jgi:hypothetical protein
MEWMPIEGAPKDESYVLLLMGGKYVSVGKWETQPFHTKPKPHWTCERGLVMGKAWDRANQPTRWMPLPPLPEPPKEETT